MLALLALALFPVVAHAECTTSSCVNYETTGVPTVPSGESKPPAETHKSTSTSSNHKSTKPSNNPKAEGSANSSGESTEEPVKEPSEESEGESHKGAGATSGGGNNNPPKGGGGESSKPAHQGAKNNDGVGPAEKVSQGGGTPTPVAHKTESSGGSSPVVPILIAVIVLAAISIGVVLYRQRKSGGQGPDRSVSSPNAS
jgi:cobalamin biosynthesis Mg chelatase CobN